MTIWSNCDEYRKNSKITKHLYGVLISCQMDWYCDMLEDIGGLEDDIKERRDTAKNLKSKIAIIMLQH